jgi:hypothetical protein
MLPLVVLSSRHAYAHPPVQLFLPNHAFAAGAHSLCAVEVHIHLLDPPNAGMLHGVHFIQAAGAAIASVAKTYKLKSIDVDISHLNDAGPNCITNLVAATITGRL